MAIAKPAAPTGVNWSRTSDTQHTVTWSNTNPTNQSAPYQFVDVYRSTNDAPAVYIQSLGVVTSYTDRGTTGNSKYQYSVKARNSAGSSSFTYSAAFATTPAAPTGVTAARTATGDILVSWSDQSSYNTGFEVSWSQGGGAWVVLANIANVQSYTHTSPSTTVGHQYRVRATTTTPVLFSAFSAPSWVVVAVGQPYVPTSLAPSGEPRDTAFPIVLSWKHNPVDTTPQTKREVQWRPQGRTNVLTNPSFEADLTGWSATGGTVSRDTTLFTQGVASLKLVTTASYGRVDLTQSVAVAAGDPWAASVDVRGSGTAQLVMYFAGSLESVTTEVALTGAWQRISAAIFAPAGATNVFVRLIQISNGTQVMNVDAVLLEQSATAGTYVEGAVIPAFTSLGATATSGLLTTVPPGTWPNGTTIEWQVRTWGASATPSGWSASASIVTSTTPLATLVYPAAGPTQFPTSQLVPVWAFFDAEGEPQAGWTVKLYNQAMDVIETRTGIGTDTTTALGTRLTNGGTYTVGVSLRDSVGLWSNEAQATFPVVYANPPTPTLNVTWIPETAACAIQVTNPPTGAGQVDAVSVQVWRYIDGDTDYRLIATDLPLGASITDHVPALGTGNTYKAVAFSFTNTAGPTSPLVRVVTDGAPVVAVNAGPGFAQAVFVQSNIKLGLSPSRAKVLRQFAGRTRPVEFVGEQRNRDITLSATIFRDWVTGGDNSRTSSWEGIEALSDLPAPACIRDCDGRRYFVSMGSPQFGTGAQGSQDLSWSFTEVDYAEPAQSQAQQ